MINRDYKLPEKENGLYGNRDYTWNFRTHWPELTIEYLEKLTGENLSNKKGSTEAAKAEIARVSRLSKTFLFNKLLQNTKKQLEYIVAHDPDTLYEVLEYQVYMFESGFVDGKAICH